MAPTMLSKSKYLNGLQCSKYLWILFHEPEKIPEPDAATRYIFDQGNLVGELAKKLFPGGIDIPSEDFMGNIRETVELFKKRRPLFEAGILAGNIYARADILNPVDEDEWDIVEVKSSTGVKDVHIHDVSYQKLCYQRFGLKIRKCFLLYINNQYVKNGEIDPEQLLTMRDISDEVEAVSPGIQDRIDYIFEIIAAKSCPDVAIGKHCNSPYECPLTECWNFLPENSVFNLYYGGKKSLELFNSGVLAIKDIPPGFKLNDKQHIQKMCEVSGSPYIEKEGIEQFLSGLHYPLYFLDFETIGPAVPLFDGTRPYQQVPFQFSLHVVRAENDEPEHFSFLAEGAGDPRPGLLTELHNAIGDEGSIVVYNQSFEQNILKELGRAYPQYSEWTECVTARMVDLLAPFRSFHYYNPSQQGSASIKKVLPALTGRGYEGMEIDNGEAASLAFQEITYGEAPEDVRKKVREDLIKYCGLDTGGMLDIVSRQRDIIGQNKER